MTFAYKLGEIKGVIKLDFIYFDAGGGHRSAAMALQQVIAQQGRPWEIRMVNLQEQLDNLDIFRRITGIRLQDYYNLLLKKPGCRVAGSQVAGPPASRPAGTMASRPAQRHFTQRSAAVPGALACVIYHRRRAGVAWGDHGLGWRADQPYPRCRPQLAGRRRNRPR